MSTHTPGPWVARPDPNGTANDFCIGLNDDCSPIDYVALRHKRDARLIAAAPELLQALSVILGGSGGAKLVSEGAVTLNDVRLARAAIDKATGAA